MTDTIEQPFFVEDIEYKGQEFSLIGGRYLGITRLWKTLVPANGRYNSAYFHTRVELSETEPDGDTAVGDREATIVGPTECINDSSETWFSVDVDEVDMNLEHTRPREKVPDWIADEGDTGYITIELTYDEELTMDEKSCSPERIEELRERYREMGY
ncbi:hypothetical protein [Halosimplex sp. J119]